MRKSFVFAERRCAVCEHWAGNRFVDHRHANTTTTEDEAARCLLSHGAFANTDVPATGTCSQWKKWGASEVSR